MTDNIIDNNSRKNKTADEILNNNYVGPIVRAGEVADAVAEAAVVDNPDKKITVEANGAYSRIQTEGEMIITRESIEYELGRPFDMNELEINLASFAGRIETAKDYTRFFYQKNL